MTVKYTEDCCSVLASILDTNYVVLAAWYIRTTKMMCRSPIPVRVIMSNGRVCCGCKSQAEVLHVIHCTSLFLVDVAYRPRIIKSPATAVYDKAWALQYLFTFIICMPDLCNAATHHVI